MGNLFTARCSPDKSVHPCHTSVSGNTLPPGFRAIEPVGESVSQPREYPGSLGLSASFRKRVGLSPGNVKTAQTYGPPRRAELLSLTREAGLQWLDGRPFLYFCSLPCGLHTIHTPKSCGLACLHSGRPPWSLPQSRGRQERSLWLQLVLFQEVATFGGYD